VVYTIVVIVLNKNLDMRISEKQMAGEIITSFYNKRIDKSLRECKTLGVSYVDKILSNHLLPSLRLYWRGVRKEIIAYEGTINLREQPI